MNKSKYIFIAVGVIVLLGLFIYPRIGKPSYSGAVPCLVPNLPLLMHIHPHLTILIDGAEQTIPANIGLNGSCERALHTHDTTGTLHVESQVQQSYTLGDFMTLWGQPMEREGYKLEMTVDGKPSQESDKLILQDKQEIVLKYTKIE